MLYEWHRRDPVNHWLSFLPSAEEPVFGQFSNLYWDCSPAIYDEKYFSCRMVALTFHKSVQRWRIPAVPLFPIRDRHPNSVFWHLSGLLVLLLRQRIRMDNYRLVVHKDQCDRGTQQVLWRPSCLVLCRCFYAGHFHCALSFRPIFYVLLYEWNVETKSQSWDDVLCHLLHCFLLYYYRTQRKEVYASNCSVLLFGYWVYARKEDKDMEGKGYLPCLG